MLCSRAASPGVSPRVSLGVSLLALATLVASATTATAQPSAQRRSSPTFSIEAGGVYAGYRGGSFRNTNDGGGFDAQANLGVSLFSLGAGYVRTTHDVDGTSENAVVSGIFVEPRLALPIAYGNFTPYVLGRVMRVERQLGSGATAVESTGTALGGGLGLLVWLAPGVQLNTSAAYYGMRLTGEPSGGRNTGTGVTLRVGLSLGPTGWGQN